MDLGGGVKLLLNSAVICRASSRDTAGGAVPSVWQAASARVGISAIAPPHSRRRVVSLLSCRQQNTPEAFPMIVSPRRRRSVARPLNPEDSSTKAGPRTTHNTRSRNSLISFAEVRSSATSCPLET